MRASRILAKKATLTVSGTNKDYKPQVQSLLNTNIQWAHNEMDIVTQNPNGIFHPPMMIENAHRISLGHDFFLQALGFSKMDALEVLNKTYATKFSSIEEFKEKSVLHGKQQAPKILAHRMLIEDVGMHWVLWYELARLLGLDAAPLIRGIERAGELVRENFFKTGLMLDKLRLGHYSREAFISQYGARNGSWRALGFRLSNGAV
ncbi:hypothetical protein CDD81_1942 [Ophiocordyceps australis]|uniref:Opine dehydrogenase domain-containing protein n=1 Tax=Ophiocordyceps australis TaxID=1399860 RepID=A0A2C5XZ47_9HYPO|nr:hypothetical protein CDD81_1942 [Ophiocordyceps australis]